MQFKRILKTDFWYKKIEGYAVSPVEIISVLLLILLVFKLTSHNLAEYSAKSYDQRAAAAYAQIKNAAYEEMSSPTPKNKYLMKNIVGPKSLPKPLSKIILEKGLKLNYLIRVYQPGKSGQPRDQLRFEIMHEKGGHIYRYTEIRGNILEQVVRKMVLDD
jgi:hypothetical protein